ncbi:MAG: hypothetical protein MUP30_09055 [Deltaproteobacteria bacterium]|nr:hypothetical protein [Deltaproteobacteria bacterium]
MPENTNYCGKCGQQIQRPNDVKKERAAKKADAAGTSSPSSKAKKQTKANSWWTSTPVYYTYLTIIGLAFVGNAGVMLFGNIPPKPMSGWGLSFWCGVTAAIIARRNDKSGWLWFFIGLIPIGFSVYFILIFLRTLLFHH